MTQHLNVQLKENAMTENHESDAPLTVGQYADVLAKLPPPLAWATRFALEGLRPETSTTTPASEVLAGYKSWRDTFSFEALDRADLHEVLKSFGHQPTRLDDGTWVYNGVAVVQARPIWLRGKMAVFHRHMVCDEGAAALNHLHELIERSASIDELKAAMVHTKAAQVKLEDVGLFKPALQHLDDIEKDASNAEETALAQEVRARLTKPMPWPPEPEQSAVH
jgi:hypothetical protein